jgi:hypothetical protein
VQVQVEAAARERQRQAERERWRAKQEQQQRDADRERLARLERQWAAHRQAAARQAQQQAHELFWRDRMRGIDELIAMATRPMQPTAQPAQWPEPYEGGTAQLGCVDFDPASAADPSRW